MATIGPMRFAKGHGTENDFVILLDPDGSEGLTAALASRLCDRRSGIGGDGVLRVVRAAAHGPARPGGGADGLGTPHPCPGRRRGRAGERRVRARAGLARPEWFMDYRNADGSVAEMCGNGIRVFARYLAQHGLAPGPEFAVATRSGPRQVRLGASGEITVEMGSVAVLGPAAPSSLARPTRGCGCRWGTRIWPAWWMARWPGWTCPRHRNWIRGSSPRAATWNWSG